MLKLIRATDHCSAITHPGLGRGDSQEKNNALKLTVCSRENGPFCRVKYVYQFLTIPNSVGTVCLPVVENNGYRQDVFSIASQVCGTVMTMLAR